MFYEGGSEWFKREVVGMTDMEKGLRRFVRWVEWKDAHRRGKVAGLGVHARGDPVFDDTLWIDPRGNEYGQLSL